MSVVEELSGDGSRIVTSWKRTTVADGDWLQHNTIGPLNERDVFLAEKIDELSGNADEKLNEEIAARIAGDEQLYDELSTVSSDFYSFSADVEASAYALSAAITAEADVRQRVDESLLGKIEQLQNATDVVDVVGTHEALLAYNEPLTKNDVVKVLVDETKNYLEYYWRVVGDEPAKPYQWTEVGTITPYYSKTEIDNKETELSSTIANTYLSANGTDISAGKNLDVVIQSNNPRVAFKTKDNVTFDGVSSTTLSATTAYGSSAKFENISATSLTALTATGNSAKFTNLSSTNLTSNNISSTKTTATTAYITNLNGASKSDTVDNLFDSAYSGAYASAWINDNKNKIAYTADFKGTNGVVTGYGTSAFAGGISSISAKTGDSTALFTGYNVNLQAGEGVGFNYGTNLLTISADGKTYADGNYIKISGNNNSINVTTPLVNSASSGYSAYDWITTKSATLSAGFGIQFTSAATTALGIKLDATINADNKIASIGGKELVGGGISSISVPGAVFTGLNVNFSAGDNIDFTTANNKLTIDLNDNIFLNGGESQSKQIYLTTTGEDIGTDGPEIAILNTSQSQLHLFNNKIQRGTLNTTWDKVINAGNSIPIVVGSTGTDLNTLYIY